MSDLFTTIQIDNKTIYRGNEFTLQREYIYAGQYETCTGKRVADLVGWRYADLTINWDTLPDAMFEDILDLSGEAVNFTFSNEKGQSVTEEVVPQIISSQATRLTNPYDGSIIWRDISLQVQFTEAHN